MDIQVAADNVYYTEHKLNANETVYLAMELVTTDNIHDWEMYKYDMGHFTTLNRGLMVVLPMMCAANTFAYSEAIAEVTGFTEKEYDDFNARLREGGFDNEKNAAALYHVAGGVWGFSFCIGNYITYVSKVPITGRFPFPKREKPWLTLKQFLQHYDNILMSVRTVLLENDVVNNRGIFRNPKSIIDGNYKKLSMLLHRFTMKWASQFFGKKYLSISALPAMTAIVVENMDKQDYAMGKNIPEEFDASFPGGFGALDTKLLLTIPFHRIERT